MSLLRLFHAAPSSEERTVFPDLTDLFDELFFPEPEPEQGTIPLANIIESPTDYRIDLAAPGFNRNEFNLEVEKDQLRISAKHEGKTEENKEGQYHIREFGSNSIERIFELPEEANSDKINALYSKGILMVNIPKKPEAIEKPARKIEVA
ncbi:MAG: Hsp20/alpha crystallin family protein [Bacteroidota bacterium]|nr:Hsp20/alpha crystallin family protein [Bacteroidota bacterium]